MTTATADKIYCSCKKGDDGTPMIYCSECKEWYHFTCINLDETDAEDISVYVCPSCSDKTGLHTLKPTFTGAPVKDEERTPEPEPPSASEDSDDNYVVDTKAKGSHGKVRSRDSSFSERRSCKSCKLQRRTRRVSYHSDSDLSDVADKPARIRKASSPSLKRIAKRTVDGPPTKKAKTSNVVDDPTRKYCLGKLEDVFRDIFLRYPHIRRENEDDTAEALEKQTEDLTEEDRNSVLESSKQFADDLEKCVFEIYSEPDKHGNQTAAARYKDRFRMLQFNLSKIDRVVLHKRIVSGHITPKEISVMSSTDLANEELKQSIKSAEQESLKQSILTKSNAPRTKITHKGLEDIEDISGRDSNRERERQLEEEERMEKERLARLRAVEPRQRTVSLSVPPESPVVPVSEGWGAPPPVPPHALDMARETNATRPPLYLHTSSDLGITEPEMNLADLINIDDEPGSNQTVASPKDVQESIEADALVVLRSPTGISPFAIQPAPSPSTSSPSAQLPSAQPPTPRSSIFDLNSLWSRSNSSNLSSGPSTSAAEPTANVEPDDQNDVVMDSEPVAANDQDFDMLLEEREPEKPEMVQTTFDTIPQVWTGKINMPLDSAIPQETPVVGRQMGGKPIGVTSGQWKTLFPSDVLRIDGRVPIENSAKFLLQMRMNPTKELVAVAFSPVPGTDESGFKILSDFLLNKGRHGLVFPWGNRPKDHHPGKEMYIIPLLSSHPLPDYIELLDDLCLPKIRTTNYLVGIWILNKGRLASPPPTLPPQLTPSAPVPYSSTPAPILTPLPSATSLLPSIPIPVPSPVSTNINARRSIDQNALAAELASLTPEQLAFVTQALANTPLTSVAAASAIPPAGPSGPQAQIAMHTPFDQRWGAQSPLNMNGHTLTMHPSPPTFPPPGRGGASVHSRQDRGRDNRESRGGRGRGRGRGDNFHMNSPVDSGWPRKNSSQRR
ncbi:hypothetical protein F5876DRAFT_31060 [Lentinula aff. lateritia]|uniref:Uncharacterized protein n=1 Tax=Lentinula aff. lateritia TaxID=2804960 RepID=A0ACC1UE58_9AGAR|nr:hypothetical protein F5876DRAFT_31060 [Lentinula aff. lateritia]